MKLKTTKLKDYSSHGTGEFATDDFASIGENVIFESGVLVFHANQIILGNNIYIGHLTILKGYHTNLLEIKDNTWIGQGCFFHSAGGLTIGEAVGIGPFVKILTSQHQEYDLTLPVLYHNIESKPVIVEDGANIGISAVILPGIKIGEGAIVGASSVVTKDVEPYSVVAGNPAKLLRKRAQSG